MVSINDLLADAVNSKASDVHLNSGCTSYHSNKRYSASI